MKRMMKRQLPERKEEQDDQVEIKRWRGPPWKQDGQRQKEQMYHLEVMR